MMRRPSAGMCGSCAAARGGRAREDGEARRSRQTRGECCAFCAHPTLPYNTIPRPPAQEMLCPGAALPYNTPPAQEMLCPGAGISERAARARAFPARWRRRRLRVACASMRPPVRRPHGQQPSALLVPACRRRGEARSRSRARARANRLQSWRCHRHRRGCPCANQWGTMRRRRRCPAAAPRERRGRRRGRRPRRRPAPPQKTGRMRARGNVAEKGAIHAR